MELIYSSKESFVHYKSQLLANTSLGTCVHRHNYVMHISTIQTLLWLTLEGKGHLSEWRQSDQEVQHYATVRVVGAVVVRLGGLVGQARGSTGMLLICRKLGGRRVRREEGREGGKQREKEKGKDEIMDKG